MSGKVVRQSWKRNGAGGYRGGKNAAGTYGRGQDGKNAGAEIVCKNCCSHRGIDAAVE